MNYVTSLHLPSEEMNGKTDPWTSRFVRRGMMKMRAATPSFVRALERSQSILGDSLLVILDSNLGRNKRGNCVYEAVRRASLNVKEVEMRPMGYYANKWTAILASFAEREEPTVWMDATDAEADATMSAEEEDFIVEKARRMGLVVEWEKSRLWGPPPSYSDGSASGKAWARQPQTSVFCLPDASVAEACLRTGIDHDQVALLHFLQSTRGWFQDVIGPAVAESTSSCGLFSVMPEGKERLLLWRGDKFAPKFFHKRNRMERTAGLEPA